MKTGPTEPGNSFTFPVNRFQEKHGKPFRNNSIEYGKHDDGIF